MRLILTGLLVAGLACAAAAQSEPMAAAPKKKILFGIQTGQQVIVAKRDGSLVKSRVQQVKVFDGLTGAQSLMLFEPINMIAVNAAGKTMKSVRKDVKARRANSIPSASGGSILPNI